MKYQIRDVMYSLKREFSASKKVRTIAVLGCSFLLILILFIAAVGLYFMKPLLGFLFANIPILNEVLFTHFRNVILPYLQEDILGMFSGLINSTNVEELKGIVNIYFEQLSSEKNIGFDSFINFTDSIKQTLFDGKVTQDELDMLRKFVTN
ncbi:MAG: hypothetical protein FD143_821 [Ignavibacteria bacterium]|nr:MAG: hypothetical protein FD143_821 [Ignavibacteria bacterium]KAF0160593.1 MAG: hypothetical protein FD188_1585 [Ignavibacteria bacterium]